MIHEFMVLKKLPTIGKTNRGFRYITKANLTPSVFGYKEPSRSNHAQNL